MIVPPALTIVPWYNLLMGTIQRFSRAFSIIEVLVAIGVMTILAVVVLLVLNPIEFFKESRDSRRISDAKLLDKVISFVRTDRPIASIGSPSIMYTSLPDMSDGADPTCSSYSLPPPTGGWTYRCAPVSTFKKNDGTGWVPVNFNQVSGGSQIPTLPVDPLNRALNNCAGNQYENYYYTYVANGPDWEINVNLESKKHKGKADTDGGDARAYEVGSNITLAPAIAVAHYPFEDGVADITTQAVSDISGNNNNGYRGSSPASSTSDPNWSNFAKIGSMSLEFDGVNDRVNVADSCSLTPQGGELTVEAWVYSRSTDTGFKQIVSRSGAIDYYLAKKNNTQLWFGFYRGGTVCSGGPWCEHNTPTGSLTLDVWHHVAAVYSDSGNYVRLYIDGNELVNEIENQSLPITTGSNLTVGSSAGGQFFNGYIDEVIIYHQALTATEVFARYQKGL